jgi:ATP-dependent Lhr-like helicase
VSKLPEANRILVETFPHEGRYHLCVYGFAGRNAMQTLGMLLTQRMEEGNLHPLGFVATDYATLVWGLDPVEDPAPLLDPGHIRADFETWLSGTAVMKKTFRGAATIAGLIERNLPQARKSGRQATFSSDILFDTLSKYDPDHLMLRITREEALRGLVDFGRIEEMLTRTQGHIDHKILNRIPPLAVPMLLERGRVSLAGAGQDRIAEEEAARLMQAVGQTAD